MSYIAPSEKSIRPRRRCSSSIFATLASLMVLAIGLLHASHATAQVSRTSASRYTPVKVWVAGKVVNLRTSAITDGREVYVPLEFASAIGARTTQHASTQQATLTLRSGKGIKLDTYSYKGKEMLALSDVADAVDGVVLPAGEAKPEMQIAGNTAYLLARIQSVQITSNQVRITSSFPISYFTKYLGGADNRSYIDAIGGVLAPNFKAPTLGRTSIVERIRYGQFAPHTARTVAELRPGSQLEVSDAPSALTNAYVSEIVRSRDGEIARTAAPGTPPSRFSYNDAPSNPPGKRDLEKTTGRTRPGNNTLDPDTDDGLPPPRNTAPKRPNTAPTTDRTRSSTTSSVADILSITFDSPNDDTITIYIETSKKVKAEVRQAVAAQQVIINIPNSRLNLEDDRQNNQDIRHPLIEGLNAQTMQNSPRTTPLTRIVLDAPRVISTSTDTNTNEIAIEITLPRSSRAKSLKGKTVVVDPGHGGSDTGAISKNGSAFIYEKDVTLAIANKLRSNLEAQGARVIMTRARDTTVSLEDRASIADNSNADLFISIHNDSYIQENALHGASTYYHKTSKVSRQLATYVQNRIGTTTGIHNRGIIPDDTLYANGLAVLRETSMPAILCEVGYINSNKDRRKLTSASYQTKVASAITYGISRFFRNVNLPETTPRKNATIASAKKDQKRVID